MASPTVTLTDPTAGGQSAGFEHVAGVVSLAFTADDVDGDLDYVKVDVDGTIVDSDAVSPVAWDTTGVADGSHTVTATAVDVALNETTDAVDVVVNNRGVWAAAGQPCRRLAAPSDVLTAYATEWWTPAVIVGGSAVGQQGVADLQFGATSGAEASDPSVTNDGTYHLLRFDGSDDEANAGTSAALDPGADDFTVVVVAKPDTATLGAVAYRAAAGSWGYRLTCAATVQAVLYNPTSKFVNSAGALTTTERHVVAIRRSGGQLSAVLDGVATVASTIASGDISGSGTFYVGRIADGSTRFDGDVFGVAVFAGRALSSAQTVQAGQALLAAAAL